MSPSRSIQQVDPNNGERTSAQIMDAMQAYAEAHQVQEMLHILLTRLLEAQPLEPFEFLINILQQDKELDALEEKARVQRFDLRREKTKKQLVVAFYKRILALQRSQHPNKFEAYGPELMRAFLLETLQLEETRKHLMSIFPKHYRDLIQWFTKNEKSLTQSIPISQFTKICMEILATMATA